MLLSAALLLVGGNTEAVPEENDPVCTEGNEAAECLAPEAQQQQECSSHDQCRESLSFYTYQSGSAQAYKPLAPVKTVVCEESLRNPYRMASWPFSRSGLGNGGGAPHLSVAIRLLSCRMDDDSCCCSPFLSTDVTTTVVEVWQTKPDGTYSSISPGVDEGVCRASVPVVEGSVARFDTVAPGSTGILNGLGPAGWDFYPFGEPSIHVLVSAPGHELMLSQIPVLMNQKLEPKSFFGPDWRGQAYTLARSKTSSLAVDSWSANVDENRIDLEVTMLLYQNQETSSVQEVMCPSSLYGTPGSFFVEPISICAPSMLGFFNL